MRGDLGRNRDRVRTFEEFRRYAARRPFDELLHEADDPARGIRSAGPERNFRFVIDPADSRRIIDLRHFFGIGSRRFPEITGLLVEVVQAVCCAARQRRNCESAFDPQDFFSNALGKEFFERYPDARGPAVSERLHEFFRERAALKNPPTARRAQAHPQARGRGEEHRAPPLTPPAQGTAQAPPAVAAPCRSVPAGATLPLPCDLPTVSAPAAAAAAFTSQPAAYAARAAAITHAPNPPQTAPVGGSCARCAADLLRLAERVCSGERFGPADLQAFGWFGADLQFPPLDPAAATQCPKEVFTVLVGRHQARQRFDPAWLNSEADRRRPAPMPEPIPERPARERRGCTKHGVWHQDCYPE